MKKIASLILSVIMLFAIAASSLADSKVYFDYMIGQTDLPIVTSLNSDNYIVLGGNYQFDNNWSVSGEYTTGTMSELVAIDYGSFATIEDKINTYKIKGSYAVINDEDLRLDISAGYYIDDEKYSVKRSGNIGSLEFESFFLGVDALFNITNKITMFTGLEFGLLGKATYKIDNEKETDDLDSLLNYKFGLNYYLTKQLGLSLGYRSSSCGVDGDETTTSGFTTGVTYNF